MAESLHARFLRPRHAGMHEKRSATCIAARMRPRTLEEYIGQKHIVSEGKLLRRAIEADKLFFFHHFVGSARNRQNYIGTSHRKHHQESFFTISAILAGKAELRKVIEDALERRSNALSRVRGQQFMEPTTPIN
jgi:putative ATPase